MSRRSLLTPDRGDSAPVPVPVVLDRLSVKGCLFMRAGQPFKMASASMFTMPQRLSRGENLSDRWAWLRARRVPNTVEWFAQHVFMNWPTPKVDPFIVTIDALRLCVQLAAREGFYVNLRCLADCQAHGTDDDGTPLPAFNQSHQWQVDRVGALWQLAQQEPNLNLVIANEPPFNGVEPWRIVDDLGLAKKTDRKGVLFGSGEYHETVTQFQFRVLDVYGDHPKRKPEYPVEAAKTGGFMRRGWAPDHESPSGFLGFDHYADPDVAVFTEEPEKYGETSFDGLDHADTSIDNAEQAGGGWGVGASGTCFHSVDGIRSKVPGPNQTACADAFFGAMAFSPDDAFAGEYTHDTFPSWPLKPTTLAGEVAGRKMPNGEVYGVCAQPLSGWTPEPKSGAAILERKGRGGTLLKMR